MANLILVKTATRVDADDVDEGRADRHFDAFDNKGRQFGAMVRKFRCAYVADEVELWDFPQNIKSATKRAERAGRTYYGFRPHALRDGALFGASHGEQHFSTAAERDAAVEKYFAQAEKRAMKNKARAK